MARFTWHGDTYEYVTKPMLSEIMYVERKLGMPGGEFTSSETLVTTWFMSVKRVRPTTTWEEIVNSYQGDFEDVEEPLSPEADTEPAEEDLPLDPTGAGTQTEPPSESGRPDVEPSAMTETTTS